MSDYFKQLQRENADVAERYKLKISTINGENPYLIKQQDVSYKPEDFPAITNMDIVSYLVLTTSFYAKDQMKAYKSLNAFKFFQAGFVTNCVVVKINNLFVLIGSVVQLKENSYAVLKSGNQWLRGQLPPSSEEMWTVKGVYIFFIKDPRTDDLFLVNSPLLVLSITATYLYLVNYALPKFMENRKPYNLKKTLVAYNVTHIILNTYCTYRTVRAIYFAPTYFCIPLNRSESPESMQLVRDCRFFLFMKILDLADTVFFILKKNYRQVSYLHVYHHALMILGTWAGSRFIPSGHSVYLGVNAPVHVVMFTYYLLSSLDPGWKNSTIVKKSITQLQLVQFCFLFFIFGTNLVIPGCTYPALPSIFMMAQSLYMFLLFADFYRKTYLKTKSG